MYIMSGRIACVMEETARETTEKETNHRGLWGFNCCGTLFGVDPLVFYK